MAIIQRHIQWIRRITHGLGTLGDSHGDDVIREPSVQILQPPGWSLDSPGSSLLGVRGTFVCVCLNEQIKQLTKTTIFG